LCCNGSTEFPDNNFAGHLPDRVYVDVKPRTFEVKLPLPKGEIREFRCPETATFLELQPMMAAKFETEDFVIQVNGKELGARDFLCAELFTATGTSGSRVAMRSAK
jgi:hypothetical protein